MQKRPELQLGIRESLSSVLLDGKWEVGSLRGAVGQLGFLGSYVAKGFPAPRSWRWEVKNINLNP